MRPLLLRSLTALLLLSQLSCATGLTPLPQSMPAARAALRPEYRLFYDSLTDYGSWTLIEPFGYVFRPRFELTQWRPYSNGFWVPTDLYGWVWVSAEPFGWATYHYGRWFFDAFQGWVWTPGVDWAPAWVNWQANDNYVGWAALPPRGASNSAAPGGAFSYAPASDLGSTDLKSRLVNADQLGDKIAAAKPVQNLDRQDGVTFNRGPSLEWIEHLAGPLGRAKIDDIAPPTLAGTSASSRTRARGDVSGKSDRPDEGIVQVRQAAEEAAQEASEMSARPGPVPARLSLLRPIGVPSSPRSVAAPSPARPTPAAPRTKPAGKTAAAPDTTR